MSAGLSKAQIHWRKVEKTAFGRKIGPDIKSFWTKIES